MLRSSQLKSFKVLLTFLFKFRKIGDILSEMKIFDEGIMTNDNNIQINVWLISVVTNKFYDQKYIMKFISINKQNKQFK